MSVVVLDEVGLAEDSPNLPLKALHPLLEDGTEETDTDFSDKVCAITHILRWCNYSNMPFFTDYC